jgi:sec-independent protein translocase protein TatB
MFSVLEVLLTIIVAVIVFGPDKLPQLSRQLGQWLLRYQQFSQQGQYFIDRQIKQAQLDINEQRARQADQARD